MDSSDWSNGIQYHIFDTRPDTEFKSHPITWRAIAARPYALEPIDVAGKKIYKYDNHYWKWELKLWQGPPDTACRVIIHVVDPRLLS